MDTNGRRSELNARKGRVYSVISEPAKSAKPPYRTLQCAS